MTIGQLLANMAAGVTSKPSATQENIAMANETAPNTTAPVEVKQTIEQKVNELQAEKTRITSEMNAMPEGEGKTQVAERIAVIDRKLRWYAGRSSQKAKVTARPSSKTPRSTRAKAAAPAAVAAAPSAVNES